MSGIAACAAAAPRPRRAGRSLALAGLALLCLCGSAAATPAVTLRAQPVAIPELPGTGNFAGAGAAFRVEVAIEGNEYNGFPPPLVGFNLYLPRGMTVQQEGFPTCDPATFGLPGPGPTRCPRASRAGQAGAITMVVPIGGETVLEHATVQPFYAPGGGIEFFIWGHSPVLLETLSTGRYLGLGGTEYGPELVSEVPLLEAVPGAGHPSFETLNVELGSALKEVAEDGSELWTPDLVMPTTCPRGGLHEKAELTFANPRDAFAPGETVTATYAAPCPPRSVEASGPPPQTALPGTGGAITAPSSAKCVSHRHFIVHFIQHGSAPYREAVAYLNGRRIATRLGARTTTPIDLRGLPKGTYVLRLTALTTSGRRITGTRTYHTCAAKPIHPSGKAHL